MLRHRHVLHARAGQTGDEPRPALERDVVPRPVHRDHESVAEADKKQAEAYVGIFRAFLKHRDAVKLVTFWGPNDANSWRSRGRPLLFDGQSKPKPAFDAVIKLPAEVKAP